MRIFNNKNTIHIFRICCALLGIFFSIIAIYSHYKIVSGNEKIFCDVSALVNCSKVIGSGYGSLFGIPLGFYGISFWLAGLIISAAHMFFDVNELSMGLMRIVYGAFGVFAALILAGISIFGLDSFCYICTIIQLLCLSYFLSALPGIEKLRKISTKDISISFIKIASIAFLAGFIPLAAGAIYALTGKGQADAASPITIRDLDKDVIYANTGLHSLGKAKSLVTITVYTDFECSWCRQFHKQIFKVMHKAGKDKILFIFKNYPLKSHKHAVDAALAARCAGRQGKFWEFADWAYSSPDDQKKINALFSRDGFYKKAEDLGIDKNKFIACFDNKEELASVEKDTSEADALGLKGTPFIMLNGKQYTGAWNNIDIFVKDIRIAAGLEKPVLKNIEYKNSLKSLLPRIVAQYIDRLFGIVDVSYQDMNNTGSSDYVTLGLKDYGIMIMILSDTDHDGIIDDFNWVLGSHSNPASSMMLYTENTRDDISSRIWYGPGNIKIIAKEDLNKDGVFETMVYYNQSAASKATGGIVARFETDTDGDGKPDVWTYPGRRMEIDANGDGTPDLYTEDNTTISSNYNVLIKQMKKDALQGLPLVQANSWAMNPYVISEKRYQAIIMRSYPVMK